MRNKIGKTSIIKKLGKLVQFFYYKYRIFEKKIENNKMFYFTILFVLNFDSIC